MYFSVADNFSSYAQLEEKVKSYQSSKYVQMWKRDCRTTATAQKRMSKRHFNPDIKYCELWYSCLHGGRKHTSNSQAQRPFTNLHSRLTPTSMGAETNIQ